MTEWLNWTEVFLLCVCLCVCVCVCVCMHAKTNNATVHLLEYTFAHSCNYNWREKFFHVGCYCQVKSMYILNFTRYFQIVFKRMYQCLLSKSVGKELLKSLNGVVNSIVCCFFSCVQLFATLWTLAYKPPLFMGFSRQEYWSGLPCPAQGIFLTQGSNPHLFCLLHLQRGPFPGLPWWLRQ